MRRSLVVVAGVAAALISGTAATAKGHIVGGVIGATVAGKHHRVAGAVIGGAVGHHMAKTQAKKQAAAAAPVK